MYTAMEVLAFASEENYQSTRYSSSEKCVFANYL